MRITKKIAKKIVLCDDATYFGGVSYIGETLDNFMAECEIPFGTSFTRVNDNLIECGIQPITKTEVAEAVRKLS